MDPQYDPKKVEGRIYQLWEKSGFFSPEANQPSADNPGRGKKRKDPFCIIMPPPNANGELHLGHALFITLEDIMTRFNRLLGKDTLWLPGTDHAGFETQVVFEKKLAKEGKSRFQFSRDELYQMMWDFVQGMKTATENGLRKLGASCDWSRNKFTLDPDIIKVVYDNFKRLYDDGLIYRGKRAVNWCTHHQTSLSDLEVAYEERQEKLWYIKYPIVNNPTQPPLNLRGGEGGGMSGGGEGELLQNYMIVATTRPETMLGDTAVAVNPGDGRYKKLVGKKVLLPIQNREIPIVADEAVEKEFGTGAVKVTPSHDAVDFDISQRHQLEIIEVINQEGKMTEAAGRDFAGLKVGEARQKVAVKLKELGLLEKEEVYNHSVALCYKCKTVIEPMVSEQWFVKIKPLAEKAVKAVKSGEVKFHPKRFEKIFFNWMRDIRDWNISRQIVWGIRIPVWYCNEEKTCWVVADKEPAKCPKCGSTKFIAESDTFDTWFSSGQWPYATLQTTKKGDFARFYPTAVMETGWDIIFFWVARMIMMGIYSTGKIPFRDVVLHGMVRDKEKQKMSKSKGNVVDPLTVAENYGADALRMSLVFSTSTGSDISASEEKIVAQKKFANKIWNAARFSLFNLDGFNPAKIKPVYTKKDKWILNELKKTSEKITKDMIGFKFHEAAQKGYHFFWHQFCDKCIEDVKGRIKEPKNKEDKETAQLVLWTVLIESLKLLHPFMPFVTEAIYQEIPHRPKKALIVENWPKG